MGTISRSFNQNMTLSERLKRRKAITENALLLDCSGSMSEMCDEKTTKIEALMSIVKNLNCKHIYAFSSYARKLASNKENLIAAGSTNLSPALNLLKADNQKSAIIITDGDVSDKSLTLEFIDANPEVKLQIIYIGPVDTRHDFLDILAEKTNGFVAVEDLASNLLEEKIRLLLKSPENKDSESIQL